MCPRDLDPVRAKVLHLPRACCMQLLLLPSDAPWPPGLPSSGVVGPLNAADLNSVYALPAGGAAPQAIDSPAPPSHHLACRVVPLLPRTRRQLSPHLPFVPPASLLLLLMRVPLLPCGVAPPTPSLLAPSCLLPICATASACWRVVPACPSIGSDSEDEVCRCDDPRSMCRGSAAVVLPGSLDSDDEVWLCHDPVLARLQSASPSLPPQGSLVWHQKLQRHQPRDPTGDAGSMPFR
jgi:hypothetical protein